jgi:hypothetical protein
MFERVATVYTHQVQLSREIVVHLLGSRAVVRSAVHTACVNVSHFSVFLLVRWVHPPPIAGGQVG